MPRAKSVLITGGARGIGWACAEEFLSCGWQVFIGDLDYAFAVDQVKRHPGRLFAVNLDVTDVHSVESAVEEVIARSGKLNSLINNAGIQEWTSLSLLDWEVWSKVLDVNLNGTVRCLHAAGRHMLATGGGSIVNVASVAAERGLAFRAPYSVSKAGVMALTRAAAMEWASQNIRVNAVGPGYVSTEMIETFVSSGQLDAAAICARIPMARMASSDEIARVIRFLASDEASYVTGQTVFVDGGFLIDYGLPSPNIRFSASAPR